MQTKLQWGGRFSAEPDAALLRFGSSLTDDLPLAGCDVQCSLAHVEALAGGGIIVGPDATALRAALTQVAQEVQTGAFAAFAFDCGAEDVHGAIDARVRQIASGPGALLHAGRSRNDQVATTLRLFIAQQCRAASDACAAAVDVLANQAETALQEQTLLPAMTHWQLAQPALLAYWLCAAAEPLKRAADRCAAAADAAMAEMPLGSAAVCGSTLPLDREAARAVLGFAALSPNGMDAIGSRDVALDGAHAIVTALAAASRVCEELIVWCNPLVGFAELGDEASTGSSLMPQKRNPDPFELVRGLAATSAGAYAGALASTVGVALSYHRDLQQTKAVIVSIAARGAEGVDAFARALSYVTYDADAMGHAAGAGFTVATDLADAMIAGGSSAREAHETIGAKVRELESQGETFDSQMTPLQSVLKKQTAGSTHPEEVAKNIAALRAWIGGRNA
ncbi:MAG TPA: argininosuccinate lyase [Candidatus Baltobacteraceae bacterium]|nr:argininosuccinate lyase [Candidatus Baltobacteraceae bacterium]